MLEDGELKSVTLGIFIIFDLPFSWAQYILIIVKKKFQYKIY